MSSLESIDDRFSFHFFFFDHLPMSGSYFLSSMATLILFISGYFFISTSNFTPTCLINLQFSGDLYMIFFYLWFRKSLLSDTGFSWQHHPQDYFCISQFFLSRPGYMNDLFVICSLWILPSLMLYGFVSSEFAATFTASWLQHYASFAGGVDDSSPISSLLSALPLLLFAYLLLGHWDTTTVTTVKVLSYPYYALSISQGHLGYEPKTVLNPIFYFFWGLCYICLLWCLSFNLFLFMISVTFRSLSGDSSSYFAGVFSCWYLESTFIVWFPCRSGILSFCTSFG